MSNVKRIKGVPHWVSRLVHAWNVRRCNKVGHKVSPGGSKVCSHCGQVFP